MRSFKWFKLLLLVSIPWQIYTQSPPDPVESTAVLQINETKLAIDGDTTLTIIEHPEELITCYYKNNILLKITAPDYMVGLFGQQYFYLVDGKLIYYERNYYNMSRMGSCGGLDIKTSYYFMNDKIISQKMEEFPFECYNDPFLTEDRILNELQKIRFRL